MRYLKRDASTGKIGMGHVSYHPPKIYELYCAFFLHSRLHRYSFQAAYKKLTKWYTSKVLTMNAGVIVTNISMTPFAQAMLTPIPMRKAIVKLE